MNFGNALFMVAEAASMGSIQSFSPWYPRSKERALRLHALNTGAEIDAMRSLTFLRGELRRGLVRFGFVAVCENSIQVNLQVTLLALSRSTGTISNFEKRALVSIVICIILSTLRIVNVTGLLRFSAEVQKAIDECERRKGSDGQVEAT